MTGSLTLVALVAVMFGAGIYVMLERSLTRVLIGFLLVGNAVNLLLYVMAGAPGLAPVLYDGVDPEAISDPLPQVFMLTAIVINLGITAFMLALIYRSWWLARLGDQGDLVDDDRDGRESGEGAADVARSSRLDDTAILQILDESDEEYDERGSEASARTDRPDRGGDRR